VAFILRSVMHYRRYVINKQLHDSFPERSEEELRAIAHRNYDQLAEMIIGTLSLAG
jgi:KDO2-lipid IV(A) lauroyltransferase